MLNVNVVITILLLIFLLIFGYYHLSFLIGVNICAGGKLTIAVDDHQFFDCEENKYVKCRHGVVLRENKHECKNELCLNQRIEYKTVGSHRIPYKIITCAPGTNDVIEKSCEIFTETLVDDISLLTNTNYVVPVKKRFEATDIPKTQISIDTGQCIEFVPYNIMLMTTHNPILPKVPLNIQTKKIQYSAGDVGNDEFYFTDYTNIRKYKTNEIIPGKFANFTIAMSLDNLEYKDNVKIIRGDRDGVTYMISFEMPPFRGRNTTNFCHTSVSTCVSGSWWSPYTMQIEPIGWRVQSDKAMNSLRKLIYDETTFTFRYTIVKNENEYQLHVITLFGFCTFNIELKEGVEIDSNGHIVIETYPSYTSIVNQLEGYNTTLLVTNIYNKQYNKQHVPIFLPYINILDLVAPIINLNDHGLVIDDLFHVPHEYIYKSDSG